jgi:spore germination cell wall hydrolase CwlJ-like protein
MAKYIRLATFLAAIVLTGYIVQFVGETKIKELQEEAVLTPKTLVSDRQKELECLARNIYWEAASEPAEGKLAVGQVVINRVNSGQFPNSICGVIQQKNVFTNNVVCQFSWVCETTHKTRPMRPDLYAESMKAAKMVLLEGFRLPSLQGVLYYHADYVQPQWKLKRVTQIGRHIFYKRMNDA